MPPADVRGRAFGMIVYDLCGFCDSPVVSSSAVCGPVPGTRRLADRAQHLRRALLEDVHHLVGLILGDYERRREGYPVRVVSQDQALLEGHLSDLDAQVHAIGELLLRLRVLHELDPHEQALATDVPDYA